MTKRLKPTYIFLLAATLSLLTACYNDDAVIREDSTEQNGEITVRFRMSQAGSAITRGTEYWEDKDNAEDKEMMNVWTVVAVKADAETPDDNTEEQVTNIWACTPSGKPDQEVDFVAKLQTEGKYRFYSFANMSPKHVMELLGITSTDEINNFTNDATDPKPFTVPTDAKVNYSNAKNKTVKIDGNGFNKFANTDDNDNGFGTYGIPMSNVQFYDLKNGDEKDLIVVRLLAKIKLQITNSGADDVTITSVVLTDVTKYDENKDNLKLFPNYTNSENANKMEAMHGDIQPNITANAETEDLEIEVNKTIETGNKKVEITFYVNESQAPTNNPKNNFGHFFLKINLSKNGTQTEERYALIDDSNKESDDNGKWDYIARNDYRIIPIELDDYKLELIPYDFPAIGVYPASVKEEDGLYTITFHDYGHFHLLPKVTKFTTTETKTVSYGTNGWSMNGSFANSWKSWESYEKSLSEQSTNNPGGFYAATANVANDDGSASINDDNDAGGIPVWYDNGASVTSWNKPQWNPADDTDYEPFIFGYIADPGANIKNGDKKVYHEFTIKVNTNHLLTYRLYMILDQDQMLYRTRALDAPAARHTHHWPHI